MSSPRLENWCKEGSSVAVPIILPKFEMSQEAATIIEWLKGEGDPVEKGEPVLIVETDKITMEVESPATGILTSVRGEPNQIVPVTEIIAYVLQPGENLPSTGTPARPTALGTEMPADVHSIALSATSSTESDGPITTTNAEMMPAAQPLLELPKGRATPAARRLAREQAIDLASVTGSGPRGRVQTADVEAHPLVPDTAAAPAAATEAIEVTPMSGIRRTIAQRMIASHRATARVTLVTEIDATALVEARASLEATVSEEWGFAPGYSDLLVLIVARALREYPYMNARLSAGGAAAADTGIGMIERLPYINLGMAVDTERGLLVPVLRDAHRKGLRAIATEFRALSERAGAGRLLPDDLRGGTFTITNLGVYDVDAFTSIINLPEAAILSAGRIQPKAVVHCGETVMRQMWTLSLTFDHRLVGGAPAARFLQRIKRLVENPFLLLG
jgi:pyruvate dehydrogenase E2 component (dihydrolipoyllysine-residue acetyltransferase)